MGRPDDSRTHATLLELLARSGGHDQEAWARFVDYYGGKVYSWCLRWGLQDADAQDVTQTVLLKLAGRMKEFTYDPGRSFRAWLKLVAHNTWKDFVGSLRRAAVGPGGGGDL
jgi:RNA polymerase sigma-70 factor (ECF subfamily)